MRGDLKLPDVVLLDMDNTIYDYEPCHSEALKKVEAHLKATTSINPRTFNESYRAAREEVHSRLRGTASSHNRLLYFQRLLEGVGGGMKIGLAIELYELYWDTFIDNIEVFDGVYDFLRYTRSLGIPVSLVTDLTADIQFRKIVRLKLEELIDSVVTSEEAGADKPAPSIFELALKKLGRGAETVWLIGDSPSKDLAGGRSIGATTFLKVNDKKDVAAPPGAVKPDFVFESFHELVEMLSELKGGR